MSIMDFLRRLFRIERNIDSITSPVTRIVNNLEAYSSEQAKRCGEDKARANALAAKAEQERLEAEEAKALAAEYSTRFPRRSGQVAAAK